MASEQPKMRRESLSQDKWKVGREKRRTPSPGWEQMEADRGRESGFKGRKANGQEW